MFVRHGESTNNVINHELALAGGGVMDEAEWLSKRVDDPDLSPKGKQEAVELAATSADMPGKGTPPECVKGPKTGDILKDAKPFAQPTVAGCFAVLKFLIMLGLYVGALVTVSPLYFVLHR